MHSRDLSLLEHLNALPPLQRADVHPRRPRRLGLMTFWQLHNGYCSAQISISPRPSYSTCFQTHSRLPCQYLRHLQPSPMQMQMFSLISDFFKQTRRRLVAFLTLLNYFTLLLMLYSHVNNILSQFVRNTLETRVKNTQARPMLVTFVNNSAGTFSQNPSAYGSDLYSLLLFMRIAAGSCLSYLYELLFRITLACSDSCRMGSCMTYLVRSSIL